MFQSSCTGGYSEVDFGLFLNMPLYADIWAEILSNLKIIC